MLCTCTVETASLLPQSGQGSQYDSVPGQPPTASYTTAAARDYNRPPGSADYWGKGGMPATLPATLDPAPDVRYPQLGSYQQQAGLAAVGGGDGNTVWPQVHVQLGNAETTAGAHWDKGAKTRSFIHVSLLQPFHKYMQDLMSVRLRCCIYCDAIIFIMMLYIKVCSSLASILPPRTGTKKR